MKNIILVDIDGTIADCSHRLHHIQKTPKDWEAFHGAVSGDAPIMENIFALQALGRAYDALFVTGRCESSRADTVHWLAKHSLWTDFLSSFDLTMDKSRRHLIMRPEGDHTDDHILKIRWLNDGTIPKERVAFALEDRTRVVEAYRAAGITCWQVNDGDY